MCISVLICQGVEMEVMKLREEAGYLIKQVQHSMRVRMDRCLRDLDITTPQFAVLSWLRESPGLSNAELAVKCFVTPQTMNLILQKLQTRQLVSRTPSKGHGKIINTALTELGDDILTRAKQQMLAVEIELFGNLPASELATLVLTLKKLSVLRD